MFAHLLNGRSHQFYPVVPDAITEVETTLKISLPNDLKNFYRELGYGFIHSENDNINRLMDPYSIRDFRQRENDFEFYPDIDIYDEFENDKLVFFEANESTMLSIGFGKSNYNQIFCYDTLIADNLGEFIQKIIENDTYYYDLI